MARTKPLTALDYFRAGKNTADIARFLRISEAEALEQVSSQRSAALHLPSPYHPKPKPKRKPIGWPAGRVAYAGQA